MNVVYDRDFNKTNESMSKMNGVNNKRLKDKDMHFSKKALGIFATGTKVFSEMNKNKIYL